MTYEFNPRNKVGIDGALTLLQVNPDCAACLDPANKDYGWLYTRHPDGHWVTLRKLPQWEIDAANDQAADMRVLNGTKVRAG